MKLSDNVRFRDVAFPTALHHVGREAHHCSGWRYDRFDVIPTLLNSYLPTLLNALRISLVKRDVRVKFRIRSVLLSYTQRSLLGV